MSQFVANDFAAIQARLREIRAEKAGKTWPLESEASEQSQPATAATAPNDFYSWLMNGSLWN